MVYAKALFDLQIDFAHKVAELARVPLACALLEYTNFYVSFGLGRDFGSTNSIWLRYLEGLRDAEDVKDWTYRFYLSRAGENAKPQTAATFGCFSYSRFEDDRVRLHFENLDTQKSSSLGDFFVNQRCAELTQLFEDVYQNSPQTKLVIGFSWLYNLQSYRRLLPTEYTQSARVIKGRFQTLPLWGQFVDRNGKVKTEMANLFLKRLKQQEALERLHDCFPF